MNENGKFLKTAHYYDLVFFIKYKPRKVTVYTAGRNFVSLSVSVSKVYSISYEYIIA